MKIPKVFGNKIVIAFVALALLIILVFSFFKIIEVQETGFAGLTPEENPLENSIENMPQENLENNNNDEQEATTSIPTYEYIEINENFPDASTPNKQSSNKKASGGSNNNQGNSNNNQGNSNNNGGNSNNNNENSNNDQENNGNNNNNNVNPTNLKKKLSKKPSNMNLKKDGVEIYEGQEFQGKVRLNLEKNNQKIAAFDIDFNQDIDLSDIKADSDFILKKAYMHSTSGILQNIDLYVPIEEGDIAVVVCSNADSYDGIYYGCSENPEITKEELLYLSSPRVERSEDGLYFIVHGITGTGATGVNVTEINSTSQNPTPPGSLESFAGNVTEITTPEGIGTTQAWAGYFGNISGTIMLADNSDNVMYNWTLSSPEGEIFASINNSISWDNIQCFNFTATGTYQDEGGNGGTTNLHGKNITQIELEYNIRYDDLDGVDETFYLSGLGTHNTFYVNSKEFGEGECRNTRINDWTGLGQDDNFEEVLLYEPSTASVIFGALLNEDVLGFDNRPHDFEMIVLEDGHQTDTEVTIYYFYAVMF